MTLATPLYLASALEHEMVGLLLDDKEKGYCQETHNIQKLSSE